MYPLQLNVQRLTFQNNNYKSPSSFDPDSPDSRNEDYLPKNVVFSPISENSFLKLLESNLRAGELHISYETERQWRVVLQNEANYNCIFCLSRKPALISYLDQALRNDGFSVNVDFSKNPDLDCPVMVLTTQKLQRSSLPSNRSFRKLFVASLNQKVV
jgi:hypothetical protein